MKFSKLSKDEQALILKQSNRNAVSAELVGVSFDKLRTVTVKQNNFFVVTIKHGRKLFIGVAKRNSNDPLIEDVGKTIAFTRALRAESVSIPL